MATIFKIDWPFKKKDDEKWARLHISRWAERQGGAAFVSVDETFIMTDYAHEHKEVGLLVHILNCCHVSYRCMTNVDLTHLAEMVWAKALIHNNNLEKKEH